MGGRTRSQNGPASLIDNRFLHRCRNPVLKKDADHGSHITDRIALSRSLIWFLFAPPSAVIG